MTQYHDEFNGRIFREKGKPAEGCTIRVSREGFDVTIRASAETIRFPYRTAVPSFGGHGNAMLIVTWPGDEETGKVDLYINERKVDKELEFCAPPDFLEQMGQGRTVAKRSNRRAMFFLCLITAIALVAFLGLYMVFNVLVDKLIDQIPIKVDVAVGQNYAESMLQKTVRCTDQLICGQVGKMSKRLVTAANDDALARNYAFRFHVVVSPQVNALAMPGGEIVIFTGLLLKADRPEEVAGVLAHEIQHVLNRHAVKRIIHTLKWYLILSIFLGETSAIGEKIINSGVNLAMLKNSRDDEFEADLSAVLLLRHAGIDPQGLPDFLGRLKQGEGGMLDILSTHPAASERVKRLRTAIDNVNSVEPQTEIIAVQCDWKAVQQRCRKIQALPKIKKR